MSETLGSAVLELRADAAPMMRTMSAAHMGTIKQMKATGAASKAAMAAGMLAVGAAVGVGLYKVGKEFDEAYNKIRVGTGATGKDLESLKDSFRKVFRDVPDDAGTVGDAIADVNTRLGLTGGQLESRTKQFLTLSRITGTDVKTNIEKVSKAFRDWEVAGKDQTKVLDGFFRISQETGISVDDLASKVQQFGSPLRQLGFSLGESASMFGIFESAGVNVETLMPGFKMAIGNVLKPTDDLAAGMKKLGIDMDQGPKVAIRQFISALEDSKDPSKMAGLAMDFFGRRAGADMVEAISQGRLSVGDMMDVFKNGTDTISKAGEETLTFSDKMSILKNRGMLALEKPATAVVNLLIKIADATLAITDAFSGLPSGVRKTIGIFAMVAAGVIALVYAFGKAKLAFMALQALMMANPYALLIAATIAIVVLIVKNWDTIKAALAAAWNWIKETAASIWGAIKDFFAKYWEILLVVFMGPIGLLTLAIIKNWTRIKDAAKKIWKIIQTVIVGYVKVLRTIVVTIWNAIRSAAAVIWQAIRSRIVDPIRTAVSIVRSVFASIRDWLRGAWQTIRDAAATIWGSIRERIVSPIQSAIETVRSVISNVKGWLSDRWNEIVSRIGQFGSSAKQTLIDAFKGAANAVIGFLNAIIRAINKIPGVPDIGQIGKLATGGTLSRAAVSNAIPGFARGGKINRPMAIVGEEAPTHPEYVIPTNPAYRSRAIGLVGQMMNDLGLQHYATGGRIGDRMGGPLDSIKGAIGKVVGLIVDGPGAILDLLPGLGDLPGFMKGTGGWIIDKVTSWIKEKIKSVIDSFLPNFSDGGGGGAGLDGWVSSLASSFGLRKTSGYRPGDDGWHGQNRARDFSNSGGPSPEQLAFATTMLKFAPRLLELIYTPLGAAVKNGAIVAPYAQEDHYDHVHVAMRKGGILDRLSATNFIGAYGSGGVLPSDGMYFGHEGEHVGMPPVVNIKFADGMGWLQDFVDVSIQGADRKSEQIYSAGAAR